jgi:AcrR family transcriptional regulator
MRADARRNHDAVLEAGARLLATSPGVSMQEIADASGLGRTTVYRHFPAREDLVCALVARVVADVSNATRRALNTPAPPVDVLRQLAMDLVAVGNHWRFLRAQREDVRDGLTESDREFCLWVERAQAAGDLRDDMPATWALAMTRGLMVAAIDESDVMGPEKAGRLLGETLVSALGPR